MSVISSRLSGASSIFSSIVEQIIPRLLLRSLSPQTSAQRLGAEIMFNHNKLGRDSSGGNELHTRVSSFKEHLQTCIQDCVN